MNLNEANEIALNLMGEYGLTLQGWTFSFDSSKRRFGSCQGATSRITLSRTLTELNSLERVRLTILHEIAHALTPGENHSRKWRRKLLEIGGNGERCFTAANTICVPSSFKGTCPSCGTEIPAFKRRRVACSSCCRKHNFGKFDSRFLFVWTRNNPSIKEG